VRGKRIVVRRAKDGEKLTTLDGIEREFDSEMLLVCDGEGPVGIAGVMGGGNSEVSDKTTTVLLEIANFKPGSVRRTATYLKLRTEASLRFEKGLGREMPEVAQHRALHLFEQLTGGTVADGIVDAFPGKEARPAIKLPLTRIEQVLGIEVPRDDIERILRDLGFECAFDDSDGSYSVEPPDWRPDVEIADDVIEDIGRIYGYDKLPMTMLRGKLPEPEANPLRELRERLRDLGAALGFQETITYTLTDMPRLQRMVPPSDTLRSDPLGVVNPVAAQHTYLRTSLRSNVLETYASNRRNQDGALRLFEIGSEYLPVEADLPHERPVFCASLGGAREGRWPHPGADRLDFYDAKGMVEAVLDDLGIRTTFAARSEFGLLEGHTAEIRAGKEVVGLVGQVHPENAAMFDIDEPVFLVELWIEDLVRHLPERPEYEAPSKFPEVRQDLALVVDGELPAGRVLELARSHRSGGVRIKAELFDEYRGPGIPAGKKSLALHLRFQAADRTLTDADVARIQQGLITRLGKELGAMLRGS
jgi:phenylalanyl-tRNA synthetase beta chain